VSIQTTLKSHEPHEACTVTTQVPNLCIFVFVGTAAGVPFKSIVTAHHVVSATISSSVHKAV